MPFAAPGHIPKVQIQPLAAGIVPSSAGLLGRWGWMGASSLLSAGEELIILFSHYPGLKSISEQHKFRCLKWLF